MTEEIKVHCAHSKLMDVTELVANPRNPNKHPDAQIALLAKIIRHQGWRNPIVVSKRSGFVVAGHGRLQAAKALNVQIVPVDYQEFENEASEWAHLIADNRIAELAETDGAILKDILTEIDTGAFDMDLSGFDAKELERVINWYPEDIAPAIDADPQIDKGTDLNKKWSVATGDIWQISEHRLLCHDCRFLAAVDEMLEGEQIDMLLTDPPYGVKYVGKTKDKLTIDNDSLDEAGLEKLIAESFEIAQSRSRPGAYWYATVPARPLHLVFASDWKRRGILRQILVWSKDSMVLGHSEYHYQHEPILFGWVPGERHKNDDRTRTTVWPCPRPKASEEHPTMKPVELWCRAMRDGSRNDEVVYDPFAGSGPTLIAAQNLERRARCIEISPEYCAVILERMATAFPGIAIKKLDNGPK